MRSALLFSTILFLAIISLSIQTTADGLDENSGIIITASFDDSTEMTTLNITMPETNNATLLDELKDTTFSLYRVAAGSYPVYIESIATNIQFCNQGMSNYDCSGSTFNIDHFPSPFDHDEFEYVLEFNNGLHWIVSNSVEETVSPILAVENLTAVYLNDVTALTWDYGATDYPMNHSIMIYSHDSPATRENWNQMSKMIVSSSIPAGTTNYQIDHSGTSVERDIYYSVTLLYATSEDTRFIGSNTLATPVWEDNVAPIFIGELSATFNSETDTTTIAWGEGVDDDDLVINIYRGDIETNQIDPNTLVASIDSHLSSYQVQVPFGEHRKSWYAMTLQDSVGNEILTLTESSPVSDPVIETTLESTTVTGISAERYGDGTVVITWDDNTNNPDAVARIWRSLNGPITSLDSAEELPSTNVSNKQAAHNPLNPQDEAWYAVTIDGAWGTGQEVWHDERLFLGLNSMSAAIRETEEYIPEVMINFSTQVLTTSGLREIVSDGAMISLGDLDQNDMIVISTSYPVSNITCYGSSGDGSVIYSGEDWALSFSANQSEEECGVLISDGDVEITFSLSWNYVETQVTENRDDDSEFDDDESDEASNDDKKNKDESKSGNKEVASTAILSIIILALVVYLAVMMRKQDYTEEE